MYDYIINGSVFGGSVSAMRLTITSVFNPEENTHIEVGQKVIERYTEKSGSIAQNIILEVLLYRSTTAHILGGCPMSDDISSEVVDPQLRVHGFNNMYVVDRAVIQRNIGGNPSYSILAIAEYAMHNIPDKYGNTQIPIEQKLSAFS